MRLVLASSLLTLAVAGRAGAGEPAPGPAVGDRLPAFTAPDQSGRMREFADLRGPRGLVLVFFRSADW